MLLEMFYLNGHNSYIYSNEDSLTIQISICQWEVAINLDICEYIHIQWPRLCTDYFLRYNKRVEEGREERYLLQSECLQRRGESRPQVKEQTYLISNSSKTSVFQQQKKRKQSYSLIFNLLKLHYYLLLFKKKIIQMDGIKALISMLITIMPVLIIMARNNRAVKNGFCIFYRTVHLILMRSLEFTVFILPRISQCVPVCPKFLLILVKLNISAPFTFL